MERNYIQQHLVIDRYLRGTLDDGEKDAFEERLVWDKELINELDLAERLREGLSAVSIPQRHTTEKRGFNLAEWFWDFFAVPQYAAAASFLLAVTLTMGVLMIPFADLGDPTDGFALETDIVPLFTTRSDDVPTITVDTNAWTVLLVDAMGTYSTYRVTVRKDEPAADTIWQQDGLVPTYPDSLAVGMPGKSLADGRYVLRVEGIVTADDGSQEFEQIQDIPFQASAAE